MPVPSISGEAEYTCYLDEFSEKEICAYMEDLGYTFTKTPEQQSDLEHLADTKKYQPDKFDRVFADFIYRETGKIL